MNYINKLQEELYVENFDVPLIPQRISEGYLKAECPETRRLGYLGGLVSLDPELSYVLVEGVA